MQGTGVARRGRTCDASLRSARGQQRPATLGEHTQLLSRNRALSRLPFHDKIQQLPLHFCCVEMEVGEEWRRWSPATKLQRPTSKKTLSVNYNNVLHGDPRRFYGLNFRILDTVGVSVVWWSEFLPTVALSPGATTFSK
jgi:hypothetical protein